MDLDLTFERAIELGLIIWDIVEWGAAIIAVGSGAGAMVLIYVGAKKGSQKLALQAFKSALVNLGSMMGKKWMENFHTKHTNQKMSEVQYWTHALNEIDNTIENGSDEEKANAEAARQFILDKIHAAMNEEVSNEQTIPN